MRICNNVRETIDAVINRLSHDKMAYVRFGDGELGIMAGWRDDEYHRKNPSLAKELTEAFAIEHPDFLIGATLYPLEKGMDGNRFAYSHNEVLDTVLATSPRSREFYNPIAFHYAALFMPETLVAFLKQLQLSNSIIVGGAHLRGAMKFTGSKVHIETPLRDAYDEIDEIEEDIRSAIGSNNVRSVLFGCGVSAAVLQKRLRDVKDLVTIDLGSTFDALLGMQTRGWINDSREMIEKLRILSEEIVCQ